MEMRGLRELVFRYHAHLFCLSATSAKRLQTSNDQHDGTYISARLPSATGQECEYSMFVSCCGRRR